MGLWAKLFSRKSDSEARPLPTVAPAFSRKSDSEARPLPTVAPAFGQLGEEVTYPVDAGHIACLNGPCRHLMETYEPADVMNIPGQAPLMETIRFCRAVSPTLDVTEATIFDCTAWEPISPERLTRMTTDRKQFPRTRWEYMDKENPDGE